MKEIVFKFIGLGWKNYHQANIQILDNNSIIYNEKTYNGKINLCLEKNKAYTLIARLNNRVIRKVFLVDDKTNKFIFSFYNYRIITFLLKDYFYNLPIEKGELILWQK